MNSPRVLVRYGTDVKFDGAVMHHPDPDGANITPARSIIVPVKSMSSGKGGQLQVTTESGDVWPVSHADHRDYEFVALM